MNALMRVRWVVWLWLAEALLAGVEGVWVRSAVFNPKRDQRPSPPQRVGQPLPPAAPNRIELETQRLYNASVLFPHLLHDAATPAISRAASERPQHQHAVQLDACVDGLEPYATADTSQQTVGRVTTFVGGCLGGFKVTPSQTLRVWCC
jgi:hypothetical protein